jgi:acetyl esterase
VSVQLSHYPEITHDFMMLNALRGTESNKRAVAEATAELREALHGEDSGSGK